MATGSTQWGLVVAFAVIVGLAGCASTVTGNGIRPTATPMIAPPLDETQLHEILLPIGELNDIVGAPATAITAETQAMYDHFCCRA